LTFTTLVTANLGLIFSNRSSTNLLVEKLRSPNKVLWGIVGGILLLLSLILTQPSLQSLFRFAPISTKELFYSVLTGIGSILWFEAFKFIEKKRS
jgi:Ca2+-transporting ATPase